MSRLTILSDVVLPHPDGPTSTQILPAGTVSERSLTAPGVPFSRRPYTLLTWRNSTVAPREDPLAVAPVCAGLFVAAPRRVARNGTSDARHAVPTTSRAI